MNKRTPLIDLHCHLDGSITADIARSLARIQSIALPAEDDEELNRLLSVGEDCKSLNDFLKCFDLPLSLLQTEAGIRECVHLVQENVKSDGVVYLEIRFAPQLSTQKGLTQRQVISEALEGLKESDLHTNLILCCMRGNDESTHGANMETIELAHEFLVEDGGVVAVDLAGAEAIFPNHLFKKEFEAAKKYSIPYTIHAGEAAGAISVQEALELGAYRIGHGIRSIEDEKVLDRIIQEGIPLECCPTSNKITKAIENMNDYPLRELLSRGVKVTVNTDDMAICRTRLSKEFEYIRETFNITAEEEKQLYLNAVEAAFCSKQTKDELRALIS